MKINTAAPSDLDEAVGCLATAFAQDLITGFLLQTGPGYRERVTQFFSLLIRARIALKMPVFVARSTAGIHGAAMGYTTVRPAWPRDLTEDWDRFEKATPGLTGRIAVYNEIAAKGKPPAPHYYLGVTGIDPNLHGLGIGTQLLKSFCDLSASDPLSSGVYLETANASNLGFYERAGFTETGRGSLGNAVVHVFATRAEVTPDRSFTGVRKGMANNFNSALQIPPTNRKARSTHACLYDHGPITRLIRLR